MKILANRKYFVALPTGNKAAIELIVSLLRDKYPKELKKAQVSTATFKWHHVGVLTERTP